MSWPQWPATGAQPALPPVVNPTVGINAATAAVVAPGLQYTQDQWAQMQQQNWQQWAQWQQQYQQWHQQYGAEYQKSLNAMNAPTPAIQPVQPPIQNAMVRLPNVGVPPPLPVETKPPLPLEDPPLSAVPPPTQMYPTNMPPNNYNTNTLTTTSTSSRNWREKSKFDNIQTTNGRHSDQNYNKNNTNVDSKRLPSNTWQNQPPMMPPKQNYQNAPSAAMPKDNLEQLIEAEKKFDKQFADWEAQFNKWKEQNAEHPDKDQYREYEKKWENWRAQLLERREQMRKKRMSLLTASSTTVASTSSFNASSSITTTTTTTTTTNDNSTNNNKNNLNRQLNFIQPPCISENATTVDNLSKINYNKPPPNLNDEPLNFKRPQSQMSSENSENDFLRTPSTVGIPGLDLVREDGKLENMSVESEVPPKQKGPDFDAITKGINTILGDQKLLSMLSLVSQNQKLATIDSLTDSTSKINEQAGFSKTPENFHGSYHEQSNQSHEDHSNASDYYNNGCPRDVVNNFDDQTRSSFTMAHNESSDTFRNQKFEQQNNRFGGGFDDREQKYGNDFYQDRYFMQRGNNFNNFNNDNCNNRGDNFNSRNINRRNEDNNLYFDGANKYDFESDRNQTAEGDNNEYLREDDQFQYDAEKSTDKSNLNESENRSVSVVGEDILKPVTVIDYDHKTPKPTEPEILIEPIHMFDYRHKPLNRIPYPQRPKWLSEEVKNIREFDPPVVRSYELSNSLRRYPNDSYDHWSSRRPIYDEIRAPFEERRQYSDKNWNVGGERRSKEEDRRGNHNELRRNEIRNVPRDDRKPIRDDFRKNDEYKLRSDIQNKNQQESSSNNNKTDFSQSEKNVTLIEDLITPPGRYKRPPRIVIILRGPPGSGKTFLAKLIKDKEVENGGSPPRILSLDDYFMVEQEKEVIEEGKRVKIKEMVYEYEANMEEAYRASLVRSFKKTLTDGYFSFIIVDNVNDKVKYFGEMWSFAKQNGFQVYICQLELDVQSCTKRNIHDRSEAEIDKCVAGWEATPSHHPILDATSLIQSDSIPEVEMEEINSPSSSDDFADDPQQEDQGIRSKWDNFDCSNDNLAKLDGVSKPLRPSRTMEEYLQMECEWNPPESTRLGQKRVRWADLEEQRQQKKMKALGFVVGHTNWDRMMDSSGGSSALTQTKYFESSKHY